MISENLLKTFIRTVDRLETKPCFRFKRGDRWEALSWREVEDWVARLAKGLQGLGVTKGATVALFSSTRVEWTLFDLAILSVGGITVPIYHSSTSEQAAYIIRDAEARIVVVEDPEMLKKVEGLQGSCRFVLIEGSAAGRRGVSSLEDLLREKADVRGWREEIDQIGVQEVATYVYTSGTTGPPKGVILTHANFQAELESLDRIFDITDRDESLLFLPLAHIVARALQFYQMRVGFVEAYSEGVERLSENIQEVRPHFFVAVPRIFEKMYERVLAQVEAGSSIKKGIFRWAVSVGRKESSLRENRLPVPLSLKIQHRLAHHLVFRKFHARLGGRLRYAVSGAAPLSQEIAEFFDSVGLHILEGYGLTETTAAINCNHIDAYRFGTVGPQVYGVEEKIAADGEILVKGPHLFQGYFKKPEATREVLTPDGWFHTGDVGEFDEEGFLKITDRKKDIIVTAGGKNVAPQNIENLLKTVPYISQVMVLGDSKKYLSALVTLNREQVERFARIKKIPYRDFRELVSHPKVYELVQGAIEEKNRKLAPFETIKKFAILEADFTQEAGELTPTLKVKRKFVGEKYREILERLYEES